MNLLGKPRKTIGIINLTYFRQLKYNIKYKIYKQWDTWFLHGKSPQTDLNELIDLNVSIELINTKNLWTQLV